MTARMVLVAVLPVLLTASLLGCTSDGRSSDQGSSDRGSSDSTSATSDVLEQPATSVAMTEPDPDFDDVAPVPPGAGGEATGPLGSIEIRVETDSGTVQIGSGSVPERLPPEFPLPSDFVVQLASETAVDLGFSGTTEWSFGDLIELYETGLPAAGYVVESIERRGSDFAVIEFSNDVGVGQVAISEAPGSADSAAVTHTLVVVFADEDQLGN